MTTLEFHPLANLFPLIEGAEFDALAGDMMAHGYRAGEQIVLLDGQILDGRNRYRAALTAQIDGIDDEARWNTFYRTFDVAAEGDPLVFVLSKNLHRRHLNETQRAMLASRIATLKQGEKGSATADGDAQAEHAFTRVMGAISQADAGKTLAVSERSVRSARVVLDEGTPELVAAVDAGKMAVSLAEKAAKLSPEQQLRVVAEVNAGRANAVRTVVKREARVAKEKALGAKQCALPDKRYGVILADPEWDFEAYDRDSGGDRAPGNHYPTSSEADICARDVGAIAADDCLLMLWVTDLARGIRVMEAWGFTYKSYLVWVKDIEETTPWELVPVKGTSILTRGTKRQRVPRTFKEVGQPGTGFWNRDRDELVLIGTRGSVPCPAQGTQGESVFFAARPRVTKAARGTHSSKPLYVHEWIERHYPNLPKIELNARRRRDGWDAWGNEAPTEPNAEARSVGVNHTQTCKAVLNVVTGAERGAKRSTTPGLQVRQSAKVVTVRKDGHSSKPERHALSQDEFLQHLDEVFGPNDPAPRKRRGSASQPARKTRPKAKAVPQKRAVALAKKRATAKRKTKGKRT